MKNTSLTISLFCATLKKIIGGRDNLLTCPFTLYHNVIISDSFKYSDNYPNINHDRTPLTLSREYFNGLSELVFKTEQIPKLRGSNFNNFTATGLYAETIKLFTVCSLEYFSKTTQQISKQDTINEDVVNNLLNQLEDKIAPQLKELYWEQIQTLDYEQAVTVILLCCFYKPSEFKASRCQQTRELIFSTNASSNCSLEKFNNLFETYFDNTSSSNEIVIRLIKVLLDYYNSQSKMQVLSHSDHKTINETQVQEEIAITQEPEEKTSRLPPEAEVIIQQLDVCFAKIENNILYFDRYENKIKRRILQLGLMGCHDLAEVYAGDFNDLKNKYEKNKGRGR